MIKLNIFILLIVNICFLACNEPESTPENNNEFPVQLQLHPVDGGLELSWQEAKLKSFIRYRLNRKAINIGSNIGDTTWTIDEYAQTKIIDKNLPFTTPITYQLTIETQSRNLKSDEVSFRPKGLLVLENMDLTDFIPNPMLNKIYFIERLQNEQRSTIFDDKTEEITMGNTLSTGSWIECQNNGDVAVIASDKINIYDGINLKNKTELINPLSQSFTSLTWQNGRYYAMLENYTICVYDEQGNLLQQFDTNPFSGQSLILRAVPNSNKLLAFVQNGSEQAMIVNLDAMGKIISHSYYTSSSIFYFKGNNMKISPNGKYIFTNNTILNQNLGRIKTIESEIVFSPNSKYLIYITQSPKKEAHILETENFSIVKKIQIDKMNVSSIGYYITQNDEVIISTSSFLNNGKRPRIIAKYKI